MAQDLQGMVICHLCCARMNRVLAGTVLTQFAKIGLGTVPPLRELEAIPYPVSVISQFLQKQTRGVVCSCTLHRRLHARQSRWCQVPFPNAGVPMPRAT
jgi:hypothetical protein